MSEEDVFIRQFEHKLRELAVDRAIIILEPALVAEPNVCKAVIRLGNIGKTLKRKVAHVNGENQRGRILRRDLIAVFLDSLAGIGTEMSALEG